MITASHALRDGSVTDSYVSSITLRPVYQQM